MIVPSTLPVSIFSIFLQALKLASSVKSTILINWVNAWNLFQHWRTSLIFRKHLQPKWPKYANEKAFHKLIIRHMKAARLQSTWYQVCWKSMIPSMHPALGIVWQVAGIFFSLVHYPFLQAEAGTTACRIQLQKINPNPFLLRHYLIIITVLSREVCNSEGKIALYLSHALYCIWRALDRSSRPTVLVCLA